MGGCETLSRLWGNCKNPHNPERVVGGSTGGEGALLASGSSPIGIGTDAAGSIRIPCSFCGVFGFKPSVKRMTKLGLRDKCEIGKSDGTVELPGTTGPMGH